MQVNDNKFYEVEAYIHNIIASNLNIIDVATNGGYPKDKYIRTHYSEFNNKLLDILKSFKELKK